MKEFTKIEKYNAKMYGEKEELLARYDSRASFYKKAFIIHYDNKIYLQSYDTIVAIIENDNAYVLGWYSQTTARHINEFLKQFNFKTMTKKEFENL